MDRRQRIANAGIALIARGGTHRLTHRAVDTEAGLPNGSTSYYARSRRDLIRLVMEQLSAESQADLTDIEVPGKLTVRLATDLVGRLAERLILNGDAQAARFALMFEVRDDPGLTVRRAPVLRDKAGYVRGYVQYMSFDIPLFFRLLLERRPDVVICEPPPTTGAVVRVVCALRRVPYAYRAADLWSDAVKETTAPPIVSAVLTRLENWVLNGASTLMTVHEGMEERLAGRGISARTRRLGFGIDTDVFTPEGQRVDTTGPLFVYAGTASEVHGAEIFVEAFRALLQRDPTARLVFIGQGESFAEIRSQAESLPEGGLVRRRWGSSAID